MLKNKSNIIISTRPFYEKDNISETLIKNGLIVINSPLIKIVKSENFAEKNEVINNINYYNNIIFTSKNGVSYFFKFLEENNKTDLMKNNFKFFVIGDSTASELNNYGHTPYYICKKNTSDDFIEELLTLDEITNKKNLFVAGNLSSEKIIEKLSDISEIKRLTVYETVKIQEFTKESFCYIKEDNYFLIIFTSPSAIESFINIIEKENIQSNFRIACIGKTTANKAIEKGLTPILISKNSNGVEFANEILNYYSAK